MPLKRNRNNSVTIQITTTEQMASHIDRITETGLYGQNRAATSERLLAEQVRVLIIGGIIQKTAKARV